MAEGKRRKYVPPESSELEASAEAARRRRESTYNSTHNPTYADWKKTVPHTELKFHPVAFALTCPPIDEEMFEQVRETELRRAAERLAASVEDAMADLYADSIMAEVEAEMRAEKMGGGVVIDATCEHVEEKPDPLLLSDGGAAADLSHELPEVDGEHRPRR